MSAMKNEKNGKRCDIDQHRNDLWRVALKFYEMRSSSLDN